MPETVHSLLETSSSCSLLPGKLLHFVQLFAAPSYLLDGVAARFTNPDIRPLKSLQLNSVFHTPHPQFPSPTAAMTALVCSSFSWPLSGLCFSVTLAGSCLCMVTGGEG